MDPVRLRKGARVWVRDADRCWVEGVILGRDKKDAGGRLLVDVAGERRAVDPRCDCEVRMVDSGEELAMVDDLTRLLALHEPALLVALHERYLLDRIYTYSGRVLLAVNPFKTLKGMYGDQIAETYLHAGPDATLPPHVYAVAARAFQDVMESNGANQTILVSGESGAGKTETTKFVMQCVTHLSAVWSGQGQAQAGPEGDGDGDGDGDGGRRRRGHNKHKKKKKAASPPRRGGPSANADIAQRVLQSNAILECFGNAATLRNDNSSRFGKLIQMKMDSVSGSLLGAHITSYLLEKSRLTHQVADERNYHIFYAMCAGGSPEQLEQWQLHELAGFRFLTDAANEDPERHDEEAARFAATMEAMRVLGLKQGEVDELLRVVAGILHLGNLVFVPSADFGEGSRISPSNACMKSCAAACRLLQIDADAMERAFCKRVINVQGSRPGDTALPVFAKRADESFEKPVPCDQAELARDALAMALYERVFGWLVWRINASIDCHEGQLSQQQGGRQPSEPPRTRRPLSFPARGARPPRDSSEDSWAEQIRNFEIGVLDVFGFEVFEQNGFEQFCINYCNERLQQLFNEFVLQREQDEYDAEGIDWSFIRYPDNQPCLDMIESRPIGLLALIDENCLMPKGSDESLCSRMYANLPKAYEHFLAPTRQQRAELEFTVQHFAGEITYCAQGFTQKNKNELRQGGVDLVNTSRSRLVQSLFPDDAANAAGGADIATFFDRTLGSLYTGSPAGSSKAAADKRRSLPARMAPLAGGPRGGAGSPSVQTLQQRTVASHFKMQLQSALEGIRRSQPHYIRCLKPNDDNVAGLIDRARLAEQLRYSGVIQIIQVARAGYPGRYEFAEFVDRYAVLADGGAPFKVRRQVGRSSAAALQRMSMQVCSSAGLKHGVQYQVGYTKVFVRQTGFTALEAAKQARFAAAARVLQRAYRQYAAYQLVDFAATEMQRMIRGYLAQLHWRRFLQMREDAACIIQYHVLAWLEALRVWREAQRRQILERKAAKKQKKQKKANKRREAALLPVEQEDEQGLGEEEGEKQEEEQEDYVVEEPQVDGSETESETAAYLAEASEVAEALAEAEARHSYSARKKQHSHLRREDSSEWDGSTDATDSDGKSPPSRPRGRKAQGKSKRRSRSVGPERRSRSRSRARSLGPLRRVTFDLDNIKVHEPTAVYSTVEEEFRLERERVGAPRAPSPTPRLGNSGSRGPHGRFVGVLLHSGGVGALEDDGGGSGDGGGAAAGAGDAAPRRRQKQRGSGAQRSARHTTDNDRHSDDEAQSDAEPAPAPAPRLEEDDEDLGGKPRGKYGEDGEDDDASSTSTGSEAAKIGKKNKRGQDDARGSGGAMMERIGGWRKAASSKISASVIPLIFLLGGLDSPLTYVSAAAMSVWWYAHAPGKAAATTTTTAAAKKKKKQKKQKKKKKKGSKSSKAGGAKDDSGEDGEEDNSKEAPSSDSSEEDDDDVVDDEEEESSSSSST